MDIRLDFKITMVNGEDTEQSITVPGISDPQVPFESQQIMLMQKMFSQYAQVGLIRQVEPKKFLLLCPSQLAFIECEIPSIIIANPTDVPPAPKVTLE